AGGRAEAAGGGAGEAGPERGQAGERRLPVPGPAGGGGAGAAQARRADRRGRGGAPADRAAGAVRLVNFAEALADLDGRQPQRMVPDLSRITALAELLDHPERT